MENRTTEHGFYCSRSEKTDRLPDRYPTGYTHTRRPHICINVSTIPTAGFHLIRLASSAIVRPRQIPQKKIDIQFNSNERYAHTHTHTHCVPGLVWKHQVVDSGISLRLCEIFRSTPSNAGPDETRASANQRKRWLAGFT